MPDEGCTCGAGEYESCMCGGWTTLKSSCEACEQSTLGKCLKHRTAILSRHVMTDAWKPGVPINDIVERIEKLEKRMCTLETKTSQLVMDGFGSGAHYVPFAQSFGSVTPESYQFSDPRSPRPRSPMKMRRMSSRIVPNVLFNKNDMDMVDGIHPFKGL